MTEAADPIAPGRTAPRGSASAGPQGAVRRAVLPWRRRIHHVSRFDLTPARIKRNFGDDPVSAVVRVLTLPLALPALVAIVLAVVEFIPAAVLTPFALIARKSRGAWPVEVLDSRGALVERTVHPSWSAAGEYAVAVREREHLLRWL